MPKFAGRRQKYQGVKSGGNYQKYGGRGLILEEKGVLWSKQPVEGCGHSAWDEVED